MEIKAPSVVKSIRIDPTIWARLLAKASAKGVSPNSLVVGAIEALVPVVEPLTVNIQVGPTTPAPGSLLKKKGKAR